MVDHDADRPGVYDRRVVALDLARLLAFSTRLQGVASFTGLLELVCAEVQEAIGYRAVWVSVIEPDRQHARLLTLHGGDPWDLAQRIPIAGDPHLERVLASQTPVVIEDAQVDPDVNREIVNALGNRTIVNVPMTFHDAPFGCLAMGTFGAEGVRVPSRAELDYLQGLAGQIVVALARMQLAKEREHAASERIRMERMLAQRQRLESLGELAGGVAHDFNNLLTVVLTTAALLRRDEVEPRRASDLRLIEEAAQRAGELTGRLLALGKRQALRIEPTDANQVLRGVVELVRRVVRADIRIELVEGARLPAVLADSSQLEQVFMNLCLNARDAMPAGGRLTLETEQVLLNGEFVRLHPWAKRGRYVLVTVTDTGTGIAPDLLDRIFEPFFTTKDEGKGSGLGLAVSRGIVEQHGGMIHAYSEVGVGTTFKVYLPISERLAVDVGTKLEPAIRTGNEHLLVADDQRFVRDVVARVLTRAGYQVATVADGRAAVEHVCAHPVDLVILDAVMPGLGGREAYTKIREARPGLPVLFASGYGAEELTTRFLADTAAPFLPKPFDPDALLRMVRRLLDEAQGNRR